MSAWGKGSSMPTAFQLFDLFVHRQDAYAVQRETGQYYPVDSLISGGAIYEHLKGTTTLGVYQLDTNNTVTWLCFDLDTHDEYALAHLVDCVEDFITPVLAMGQLHQLNRCFLVEESGRKGYHVWVFFDEPIPAWQVRSWVYQDFMPMWGVVGNDLKNDWPLEVFPKQDAIVDGGYGNLVKLPFGKHQVTGNFSKVAGCNLGAKGVDSLCKLHTANVPLYDAYVLPSGQATGGRAVQGDTATARLQRGEVLPGERNNTFASVAWHFRCEGLDKDLLLEQLDRWNNGLADPLEYGEIEASVEGAYRKSTPIEPSTHKPRSTVERSARPWAARKS